MKPMVLGCMTVAEADRFVEGSLIANCADCKEAIWYDPACAPPGIEKVCMQCVVRRNGGRPFIGLMQRRSIEAAKKARRRTYE